MTVGVGTTGGIRREAAALAGVAWSYLAALARGSSAARGSSEAGSILTAFRGQFNENRSTIVDAAVSRGYPRAEAEADIPRTLRPVAGISDDDSQALTFSLWPYLDIARAAGETGWGDADQLYDAFVRPASGVEALRAWFLDTLASVWPQGTANAHGRLLWWFASGIRNAEQADTVFSGYIFQGADNPEPTGSGASTIQDMAARIAAASEGTVIEGPEIRVTAPPSNRRSALWWVIAVAIAVAIAGTSYGLYAYQKKHGGRMPWQRSR